MNARSNEPQAQCRTLRHCKTPGNQGGYLYEVPLLTVFVAVASVVLAGVLPAPWSVIPLVIFAAAILFFLYYNFVRSWLPGKSRGNSPDETNISTKRR